MDIPVKAEVHCKDGPCGRSSQVIVNPATEQVTDVVVTEPGVAGQQRLVPIALIAQSTPHLILLNCAREELSQMRSFVETEYIRGDATWMSYPLDSYFMTPMVVRTQPSYTVTHKAIPPDELAVSRGTRVQTTDGSVGHVDEFLVEPSAGHITHLILREGHLWAQREVSIPVSEIDHIDDGVVYLKLSTQEVDDLPEIPVRRGWL